MAVFYFGNSIMLVRFANEKIIDLQIGNIFLQKHWLIFVDSNLPNSKFAKVDVFPIGSCFRCKSTFWDKHSLRQHTSLEKEQSSAGIEPMPFRLRS